MNRRPEDALSAEERVLAELLARDAAAGQAQPSAALDAAILGAAREAVDAQPATKAATPAASDAAAPPAMHTPATPPVTRADAHHRGRRRRRWSLGVGTAAAVLLATTLAWQLRPGPEMTLVREAPPPAVNPPAPLQALATAEDAAARPDAATPTEPAAGAEAPPVPPPRMLAPPRPREAQARRAPAPAFAPPAVVPAPVPAPQAPEPRPTDIAAPPAPAAARASAAEVMAAPPPPPPAPPAPAPASAPDPAALYEYATPDEQRVQQVPAKPRFARAPRAKEAEHAPSRPEGARTQRVMRTDTLVPVADDSLLSREDWIERIRTRYGLGDVLSARRSLQLFVQMHPHDKVPDDLQPLLRP